MRRSIVVGLACAAAAFVLTAGSPPSASALSCAPPGCGPTCKGAPANLVGTGGDDRLRGSRRRDVVVARGGNDRVATRGNVDTVCGNGGQDRIGGGAGPDGDRFAQAYSPGEGLYGQRGADSIAGGADNDNVVGGRHRDALRGGPGRDRLAGGRGADRLDGGADRDLLLGARGDDRIDASDGRRDTVRCGSGEDVAIVDAVDRVSDSCERIRERAPSSGTESPPRPILRSHGKRVRAASWGFCPREAVEANECVLTSVFLTTRPLPVHGGGPIRIRTRARAAQVEVDFDCGGPRAGERRSARRWRVQAPRAHGEQDRCNHATMSVRYADEGRFEGGTGYFQLSTRPHRHER